MTVIKKITENDLESRAVQDARKPILQEQASLSLVGSALICSQSGNPCDRPDGGGTIKATQPGVKRISAVSRLARWRGPHAPTKLAGARDCVLRHAGCCAAEPGNVVEVAGNLKHMGLDLICVLEQLESFFTRPAMGWTQPRDRCVFSMVSTIGTPRCRCLETASAGPAVE